MFFDRAYKYNLLNQLLNNLYRNNQFQIKLYLHLLTD